MRTHITWVVVGAIVVVAVLAGLDALRSGGERSPASGERERAVTTTPTEAARALLAGQPPVRLRPGLVSTDLSPPVVTFTVPPGWYGSQDETGFVLGMGLVGDEVDLVPGGITVYILDSSLHDAAKRLAQVKGIRVKSPVRIGGSFGRRYVRRPGQQREVTLATLGFSDVVVPLRPDLILLGKGGRRTLIIRREFTTDAARAEVNGVLMSFRGPG